MIVSFATITAAFVSTASLAAPSEKSKVVIDYWTPERISKAIPRHMVVDKKNGLGYIMRPDGSLKPHGHNIVAEVTRLKSHITKAPNAKPSSGNGDSEAPLITQLEPEDGAIIGAEQRFSVSITDASGVRSATLTIIYPSGQTQDFTMVNSGADLWENTLSGFTDGNWSWRVQARDGSKGKGNSSTSGDWGFTVDTGSGGSGGGSSDSIANSGWGFNGDLQTASGRLLYEMPNNRKKRRWSAYVCSGTVVTDNISGRSIIVTAAHCVYDDANKAFARNVLFIPNQDQTTGSGTDGDCSNDPLGCWAPSFGVVDENWTTRTFPENIPWDYAYYVVSDTGAHAGSAVSSDALDVEAGDLPLDFSPPTFDDGTPGDSSSDFTYGLGYSYSDDPNFMFCADDMTTNGSDNWWIPVCRLSGGSSGGPWVQDMTLTSGSGPIISVNSWGYSDGSPGMAGPKLSDSSAFCLFNESVSISFASIPSGDGGEGVAVNYCN